MPRCRWWDVEDYEPWIEKFNYAFEYDETSESYLRWKNPPGKKMKPGDVAGTLRSDGYWCVLFEYKKYLVHHVIWIMHGNTIPEPLSVDHDDRKRTNNNINNLRLLDDPGQGINRKGYGTSKYKGVCRKEANKKWQAEIKINGKRKYLGLFENEIDAALAWDAEAARVGRTDLNFLCRRAKDW